LEASQQCGGALVGLLEVALLLVAGAGVEEVDGLCLLQQCRAMMRMRMRRRRRGRRQRGTLPTLKKKKKKKKKKKEKKSRRKRTGKRSGRPCSQPAAA
jgi:hypothetical protein